MKYLLAVLLCATCSFSFARDVTDQQICMKLSHVAGLVIEAKLEGMSARDVVEAMDLGKSVAKDDHEEAFEVQANMDVIMVIMWAFAKDTDSADRDEAITEFKDDVLLQCLIDYQGKWLESRPTSTD